MDLGEVDGILVCLNQMRSDEVEDYSIAFAQRSIAPTDRQTNCICVEEINCLGSRGMEGICENFAQPISNPDRLEKSPVYALDAMKI